MSAGRDTGGYEDIPPPSKEGSADDPTLDESALEKQYTLDLKKNREILELQNFQQDIEARSEYANKLYRLIRWWLIGIGVLILLQGLTVDVPSRFKDYLPISFSLSDKVLIAILTGTTVNILGLFLVVARYFYKSDGKIGK